MPGFVYIVDDDASFRTAMKHRLKHADYEVATYASALHLSLLGATPLDPLRIWVNVMRRAVPLTSAQHQVRALQ